MTWNLPPWRKKGKANRRRPRPAQPESDAAGRTRLGQAPAPAEGQDKKVPRAKIGGELESLEDTMKGPLDALIESEALAAGGFDDPMAGPQLNPAAPKKFKLRRFLKNLFRREHVEGRAGQGRGPQTSQAGIDQLGRGRRRS